MESMAHCKKCRFIILTKSLSQLALLHCKLQMLPLLIGWIYRYSLAVLAVVASLRDGMNLVSLEYVTAQQVSCDVRDGPGMLVLSEFAGVAQSLSGAIRVNPWNIEEMALAYHQAISTEPALRELQQMKLYRYVSTCTASAWARGSLEERVPE